MLATGTGKAVRTAAGPALAVIVRTARAHARGRQRRGAPRSADEQLMRYAGKPCTQGMPNEQLRKPSQEDALALENRFGTAAVRTGAAGWIEQSVCENVATNT